jgi:uncharacterized protein YbcC (UPF0753/DUF2309 family)
METEIMPTETVIQHARLIDSLRNACKKIAPLWSLDNFVAVNPYLGFIQNDFKDVATQLELAAAIQTTLPISFYLKKINEGVISKEVLEEILSTKQKDSYGTFIKRIHSLKEESYKTVCTPTVADVISVLTDKDWNRFLVNRISFWAASYFDDGQATWKSKNKNLGLFLSWKTEALIDCTPELTGLIGFRKNIQQFPNSALAAAEMALNQLNVPTEMLPLYLHRLLMRVGGWSAFAARVDWDKELYGGKDGELIDFLAVVLCFEASMLSCIEDSTTKIKWQEACIQFSLIGMHEKPNQELEYKLILQEAFDRAMQEQMIQQINSKVITNVSNKKRASAQAVFCIDVRSEVFRRNLESVDNTIETLGFAGFFAFSINYVPLAHQHGDAQCPVLLKTGPTILEEMSSADASQKAYASRVLHHHTRQLLKSVKHGAVTCFSYVSPFGLSFLPKLFTDSFGLTRPVSHPDTVGISKSMLKNKRIRLDMSQYGNETTGMPLEQQITMAKTALTAMSLKGDFAKFVLITGHGSSTVNNPHATGLDCGACGGHSGESNARVAAAVFNNVKVREGLAQHNIHIPTDTVFLACFHDTTTDEIHVYNEYDIPSHLMVELATLKKSLKTAGKSSRIERATRMSSINKSDISASVIARSKDWSQIRPEWGLAGCYGFVVAPRERTKGIDFGSKSFLHSYDWEKDTEFSILELIMTAPMVVTSWINLQYYASTVDNKNFGSGNKTLHNITAGVGVLEGYSGDLRVGLPLQSVFDGENYQHEPVKLNVVIEAPMDAMNKIIAKHEMVRNLVDNNWIQLLAMNEDGKVSHRYEKGFYWSEVECKN